MKSMVVSIYWFVCLLVCLFLNDVMCKWPTRVECFHVLLGKPSEEKLFVWSIWRIVLLLAYLSGLPDTIHAGLRM